MKFLYRVTFLLLVVSVGLMCYVTTIIYRESIFANMSGECLLYPILAGLTYLFRRSMPKSIVLSVTGAVLLFVTLESCLSIFSHPDGLFMPLLNLRVQEWLVFASLILTLIIVQSVEYSISKRRMVR